VEGWVRSIYSRALLAYFDGTGDKRVVPFLTTAYSNYTPADSTMRTDQSHQGSRSMTQMEALLEGHAYGGPESMVQTALGIMGPAAKNGGYAFLETLLSGCLTNASAVIHGGCEQFAHGVTFNELAKLFAMAYSWSGNTSHLRASTGAYEMMETFDMQPHGVNSADEDLNGISPNVATETCDVADFIYSSSWMLRITGDGKYGDRLEKAFHNGAPAAVNRSFLGHVYFQSPNYAQVSAANHALSPGKWEEAYIHTPPCCTGNQARMLPNYVHHMWFGTADGGLAASMYGPNKVSAVLAGSSGPTNVTITTTTCYPFCSHAIKMGFEVAGGGSINFPLLLRIPSWCQQSSIRAHVNGQAVALVADTALPSFFRLDHTWNHGDNLSLALPMQIRATKGKTVANGWGNTTVADGEDGGDVEDGGTLAAGHMNVTANLPFCTVERGPLLFALALEPPNPHRSPGEAAGQQCSAPVSGADKASGRMIRSIANSSREFCCSACIADPTCDAWVRRPSNGDCFLCNNATGTKPAQDREVYLMPTPSPPEYNYAVKCEAASMALITEASLPSPFDWPLAAPVKVVVSAQAFEWGDPWRLPDNPVASDPGAQVNLTLVPYGSAKQFHISMFPVLE
jgi:hypothetical protein